MPNLAPLIEREQYFAVHAPRQTGKTTGMRTFAETLRGQGFAACWATLEASQGIDETAQAEPLWLQALHDASCLVSTEWRAPDPAPFLAGAPGARLGAYLRAREHTQPGPAGRWRGQKTHL